MTTKPEDTTTKPEDTTTKPADTTAKTADTTAKTADTTAKTADTTAKTADTPPPPPVLSGTKITVPTYLNPDEFPAGTDITVVPPPDAGADAWPKTGWANTFHAQMWALSPLIRAALAEAGYHDEKYLKSEDIAAINAEWSQRIPIFFVMFRELFSTTVKSTLGEDHLLPEGGAFRNNTAPLPGFMYYMVFDETTLAFTGLENAGGDAQPEATVLNILDTFMSCEPWADFSAVYTGDKTEAFYLAENAICMEDHASKDPFHTLQEVIGAIMKRP